MRIHRIDLSAYGRFDNASIVFGPADKRVHLVYGPNEAGKSTLLRAIWRYFYGDLRKSSDDYQYSVTNLRISMALESAAGDVVYWTRRGGGARSLFDEKDEPVAPALMQKWLSDISEEGFQAQFAINHDQLREGSEELYQEKGELGAALFSAATGLGSVGRIADELEKEASEVYKARASTLPINKALKQIKELKDSLRKSSVSTAKYNEVTKLRDDAAARVQNLHAEKIANLDRQQRLQRIVAGIPKIVRFGQLASELASLPPAPSLGPEFGPRRHKATANRLQLEAQIKLNADRMASLRETLSQISADPAALELLPQLQTLHDQGGSYKKAVLDRAKLETEVADNEREVQETRRGLSDAQTKALAPSRQELQHFRGRLDQYKKLAGELRTLQREVNRIEAQLTASNPTADSFSESIDLQPLKSAVAEAQIRGTIDQELEKLELQIAQMSQGANTEASSLAITKPLDEFAAQELPSAATIADFDRKHAQCEKRIDDAKRQIKDVTEKRDALSHRLTALLVHGPVPTEEEASQARNRRDELWRDLRAVIDAPNTGTGKTPLLQKLDANLTAQFEAALREADRLADLLRSEAQRIAERLKLEADQTIENARLQATSQELAKLEAEQEAFLAEWRAFMALVPTTYRTPPELKEWRPGAVRLHDLLRELANLKIEQSTKLETRRDLVKNLADACESLGLAYRGNSLNALLPQAQELLQRLENEKNRRLAAVEQLTQLRARQTQSRQEMEDARVEAEAVWKELLASAQKWNWGEMENPIELDRLLQVMDALERLETDIRAKQHRIAGMDRDAAELKSLLAAIAGRLTLAPASDTIESMLSAVYLRLEEARSQQEQSKNLSQEIAELDKTLAQQRQKLAIVDGELKALLLEAGADSLDALPHIELAAQQRSAIESEKKSIETQLDAITEDQTREAFAADCQRIEMATAKSEIGDLQSNADELEKRIETARDELRAHEAWLRDNRTLEKVAAEEQLLQETLSELSSLVREHVKTRLASQVLHRAMQRYRDENQTDLLREGGEIFSRLTAGGYSGIRCEIGDSGAAELQATRGDGSLVPLERLSDGARDQLYLALRIATLGKHFAQHSQMPFIVDDIFVMFDDSRTIAALEEFARMAESTQVIIFTHHAHVLELALNRLGERCVTHELTQSGPFRTSAQIHQAHAAPVVPAPVSATRKRGKKEVAGGQ